MDISSITGLKKQLMIMDNGKVVKTYDIDIWNPILIALAQRNLEIVKHFFAVFKMIHRLNVLSKPYTKERQKKVIFDHSKRLQRECFGLKLTIINKDEECFKFLWGGDMRTFWNIGHFFICLK